MPIILDNLEDAVKSIPVTVSPQYFSKTLTGSGKKTGLLNENLLPARNTASVKNAMISCRDIHTSITTGTTEYETIPMDFLSVARIDVNKLPESAVCISPDIISDDEKLYMLVLMKNMVVAIEDNPVGGKTKTVHPMYMILIFKPFMSSSPSGTASSQVEKYTCYIYTEPCLNVAQFANMYSNIDADLITDYFDSLSVYDIVCETVNVWMNDIPGIIETYIDNGISNSDLKYICGKLNNYSVNLEDYKKIYDIIASKQSASIDGVTSVNLNLLLNDALKDLEQNKPNIATFTPVPWNQAQPKLSREQMVAVTTTEPCCIIQAGAGTGKSTVIHNRLKYMAQCGVDLREVMVLSFTNAAANHIKDLAPQVNSKTIASMIHDIYACNYEHQLSTIDTMLNVLYARKDIIQNQNLKRTAQNLIDSLKTLKSDINGGLIQLSDLVKTSYDEVIEILNNINQTTLELESIICYHAGTNLVEPNLDCKHLIMDEVQDNSIFEFIYIIRYIIRHSATLYLVGDCSQTLYEFRASNPKALNCLEMSGVFKCMQLQTNYRSNQNILDFANLTLASIEANQFAKIQLHANSFFNRPFAEDVQVKYRQLANRTTALYDALPSMFSELKDWIQDKLDKKEQVCFLAYKRKELIHFEKAMAVLFPQNTLINIVPQKAYAQSFFSKYVNYFGEDYHHKLGGNTPMEITRHMVDNIDRLVYDTQKDIVKQNLKDWGAKYAQDLILKDLQLQTGNITEDEFKSYVFETLIAFEIDKNAMKQRLISVSNEKLKNSDISDFNFVCSTIHSAKGLEFDNVILLFDEANKDEETKRMYYVGLTRAKNAEVILAYNTTKGSKMLDACSVLSQPVAAVPEEEENNTQTVAPIATIIQKTSVMQPDAVNSSFQHPSPIPKISKRGLPKCQKNLPKNLKQAHKTSVIAYQPRLILHKPQCNQITKTGKPGRKKRNRK